VTYREQLMALKLGFSSGSRLRLAWAKPRLHPQGLNAGVWSHGRLKLQSGLFGTGSAPSRGEGPVKSLRGPEAATATLSFGKHARGTICLTSTAKTKAPRFF